MSGRNQVSGLLFTKEGLVEHRVRVASLRNTYNPELLLRLKK